MYRVLGQTSRTRGRGRQSKLQAAMSGGDSRTLPGTRVLHCTYTHPNNSELRCRKATASFVHGRQLKTGEIRSNGWGRGKTKGKKRAKR